MPTVLDDLKEQLHLETAEHGPDSFMAKQLKRQIAEAESKPADDVEYYHGGSFRRRYPQP